MAVLQWKFFRDCTHRAFLYALLATGAVIGHRPSQNTETGKDREEGPQRAEITTPEPLAYHPQSKDDDENKEDKEIDLEQRQRHRRNDERVFGENALNLRQEFIEDKYRRGVKRDDQRPCDETNGIENIHHLKGREACDDGKEKDPIAQSSERLIIKPLGPFLFTEEDSIEEVDRCTHRAEPTAEEIAKDHHEKEHSEGREHSQDDTLLREDCNDSDEGVESKIEIYRNFQFEGESCLENQIEKEAERKGLNRPPQVRDHSSHVALTLFIRTFERSISPNPNS